MVIVIINILQLFKSVGNKTKNSALELGGKLITPVLQPMGIKNDNWPASVALIVLLPRGNCGNLRSLPKFGRRRSNQALDG